MNKIIPFNRLLPRKSIAKVSLVLLLAVAIIVASMRLTINMTEKQMSDYAESEVEYTSAAIKELTDDMFITDNWIFNTFLSGMTMIDCQFDSLSGEFKVRHTIDSKTLSQLTTTDVYRRLKSFMEYNDDYLDAIMIFEPHVLKDAPDGIAAAIYSFGDNEYNLLDEVDIFNHDLYKAVKEYDRPRRTTDFVGKDSTWVMTTAIPLFDEKGTIVGEFWVDWDHHHTSQELHQTTLNNSMMLAIIDNDCRIIASYDSVNNGRQLLDVAREIDKSAGVDQWYDDVAEHVKHNNYNAFKSELEDGTYITYVSPIEKTDYKILFVKSEDQIYRVTHKFIQWSNIVMLISILLISLCLIYIFHVFKRKNDENGRMESELSMASEIQRGILPKNPTLINDDDSSSRPFNIFGFQRQAKSVGGDLYDFVQRGNHLHFCIGDVSGKGMPAALVMTELCSLYRYIIRNSQDPQEIVTLMNKAIMERSDDSMFCTLCVGVLDLTTGMLEYCNAGHNPPIFISSQESELTDSVRFLKVIPNMPIYAFDDYAYKKEQIQLKRGDRLFFYTDGVTEARNLKDEFYGDKAILSIIKRLYHQPFNTLVDGVLTDLKAFTQKAEQNDDITMLCVEYRVTPSTTSDALCAPRGGFPKTLYYDNIKDKVTEIVDAIIETYGMEKDMRFRLALEEPIQNISDYAYETDGPLWVESERTRSDDDKSLISITLIDAGKPFNPLETDSPDLFVPLEKRDVGGLGIHFTRTIMSEVTYTYEDNKNKLNLKYTEE